MSASNDQLEQRKVMISSLVTCIYLPCIITLAAYKGNVYFFGESSSGFILGLIVITEWLKSYYLKTRKRNKNKNTLQEIKLGLVCLMGAEFVFFCVIIFTGPVLNWSEDAMMLSSLLTALTVFPLLLHIGMESTIRLIFGNRNYGKLTIVEMLVWNGVMTVSGTFIGAIVFPPNINSSLDKWLIPSYLGAIEGFWLSHVLTILKVIVTKPAC